MRDPVTVHLRTDGFIMADDAAAFIRGTKMQFGHEPVELIGTVPAQVGDIWECRWSTAGTLAGYAICCPKCLHVHAWCQAHRCQFNTTPHTWTKPDGSIEAYTLCGHHGISSCWNWTGDPAAGTLSATPSLHCVEALGGCGWHGHLTNNVLKHC